MPDTSRPALVLVTTNPKPIQIARAAPDAQPKLASRGALEVSGCNTVCVDCEGLDGVAYVIGRSSRGKVMFPRIASDGRVVEPGVTITPGTHYYCSANVTVGDSLTLDAHPSPRFEFVGWKGFFEGDYCPCEATKSTTCKIDVSPDVISRYGRAYCGAIWKLRHGGQIAR